jgi:3-oxoacyl-(acyl-carrier-protein) synthase
MAPTREVVITGIGVVSPIGIGTEQFWTSLLEGRSGVRSLGALTDEDLPANIGAPVMTTSRVGAILLPVTAWFQQRRCPQWVRCRAAPKGGCFPWVPPV